MRKKRQPGGLASSELQRQPSQPHLNHGLNLMHSQGISTLRVQENRTSATNLAKKGRDGNDSPFLVVFMGRAPRTDYSVALFTSVVAF